MQLTLAPTMMMELDQQTSDRRARGDASAFFGRVVVGIVLAAVVSVGAVATFIGQAFEGRRVASQVTAGSLGSWQFLVSAERPPQAVILAALAAITLVAICAVGFEAIGALLSISPLRRAMGSLRGVPLPASDGTDLRITVLVPAHNEERSLPITLAALVRQARPPDRVIVIADNCTDRTVQIALDMGHEAFETVANRHKKGGALNQALTTLLPLTDPNDAILVMDADTSLNPRFIEVAAQRLVADPELAAVGGIFRGEPGHGLVGQFQRNEYARYGTQIAARRGRVFVLTGTATMFRASALMDVAAARGVFIPGEPGQVYDTAALTEDNELTLALKSLGATMVSPAECTVITEVMPTWRNLWIQRQRWQRGALENLGAYGFTRATLRYWGQQVGIGYGTVALNAALILMLLTALAIDEWIWFPFWTTVGLIFLIERIITAWRAQWRGRLLAATLLPELAYDVFLQAVFISCLVDISMNRQARWGHVQHGSNP